MGQGNSQADTGDMYIQFMNDVVNFAPGQCVQGQVHVHVKKEFESPRLVLSISGEEKSSVQRTEGTKNNRKQVTYTGDASIIKLDFPLVDFAPGPQAPGYYSFPFSLQLPDWLPSSFYHLSQTQSFKAAYKIRAYFEIGSKTASAKPSRPIPRWSLEYKRQQDEANAWRLFGCERPFFIFRAPPAIVADVNMKMERTRMVGGFFGAGASSAIIKVYFQKSHYVPGEVANVRFVIDNTNCKCDVWGLKLKLRRDYKGLAWSDQETFTAQDNSYLVELKEFGECAAGAKCDRTMQIRIPKTNNLVAESRDFKHANSGADANIETQTLTCSMTGRLVSVNYKLKAYVKHKSWTELGEGQVFSFPITISRPLNHPIQMQQQIQIPEGWHPSVYPLTQCVLQEGTV